MVPNRNFAQQFHCGTDGFVYSMQEINRFLSRATSVWCRPRSRLPVRKLRRRFRGNSAARRQCHRHFPWRRRRRVLPGRVLYRSLDHHHGPVDRSRRRLRPFRRPFATCVGDKTRKYRVLFWARIKKIKTSAMPWAVRIRWKGKYGKIFTSENSWTKRRLRCRPWSSRRTGS